MDGIFGHGTAAKVKEWQAKRGLKQDGIIVKESLAKIEIESEDENIDDSSDSDDGDIDNN
jgi:peptidoglycan hydrolase-like protein with peptidoglycan-binding domain